MSKCRIYRLYKSEFKCDKYFSDLPLSLGIYFSIFRCMNHRLQIEYGRFSKLERANRTCKLCRTGDLGANFIICSIVHILMHTVRELFLLNQCTGKIQMC